MKLFLPLLAVLLAGCDWAVESTNPFYTEELRQAAPELRGEWNVGSNLVWCFTGERAMSLRLYEERGFRDVPVVPFAVNGRLFLDFQNAARHTLYAVELTGDRDLKLAALSGRWLTNALATGTVKLPTIAAGTNAPPVFAATPAQWSAFLHAHATNSAIYGPELELTRSPNANFRPARRQPPL